MTTLNEMITAVIGGSDDAEYGLEKEAGVREGSTVAPAQAPPNEIEKLASALEFVGRRGVSNFGKTAAGPCKACGMPNCKCPAHSGAGGKCICKPMSKKAMHGGSHSPSNNMGQHHKNHTQKQVQPHSGAPSMKEPGYGQIPNNMNDKPGGGGSVDTSGKQTQDHHSALGSNEAAINYDKKAKAQLVSPSLSALLDTKPYADPKLKENLSNAGGKGDKNIHSKTASAPVDKDLLRQALSNRMAAASIGDQ